MILAAKSAKREAGSCWRFLRFSPRLWAAAHGSTNSIRKRSGVDRIGLLLYRKRKSCERRKKKRRGERVPLEMAADLYTDTDEDTKQIRQLYARINKLGIMDRALVLLWLENLSYEEIGAIAGISAKNVSVKLVRIKQQLMKMSDNQEF